VSLRRLPSRLERPNAGRLGASIAIVLAVLVVCFDAAPARAASIFIVYHTPQGMEPDDVTIGDGGVIFQIRNGTGTTQSYAITRTRGGVPTVLASATLAAGGHFTTSTLDAVAGDVYEIASLTSGAMAHFTAVDKSTIGMYQPDTSAFFLRNSNDPGPADLVFQYGPAASGWTPLVGSWDGFSGDTVALYDPATSAFFLKYANSPGAADVVVAFGAGGTGFVPLGGDWNGDGWDTVGLYDPSSGYFYIRNQNAPGPADSFFGFGPGGLGWKPIVGDWDGDGVDTVGVYAPDSGAFFLKNANSPGPADVVFTFGPSGASLQPLAGDWDGNGTATIGLYDPATGALFLKNATSPGPADVVFQFGAGMQIALAGDW
jgi:hypothetical protein